MLSPLPIKPCIGPIRSFRFMSPFEAKQIIDSLANGIDPDTGEILSAQGVFNSPQVIRALFIAGRALDNLAKRAERDGALPENAGRSWSAEEDKDLLAMFDSGLPVKDISAKHARTHGAITARLVRLGRIKDRAAAYASAPASMPPDAVR
jgi:hypothetical protein